LKPFLLSLLNEPQYDYTVLLQERSIQKLVESGAQELSEEVL